MPAEHISKNYSTHRVLQDATARINNRCASAPPQKPSRRRKLSPPPLPHHESRTPNGNLLSATSPPQATIIENKHLSALTVDSQGDKNRLSQLSEASTNASTSSRTRKKHIGPWRLGTTLGKGATGRVRKAKHAMTGQVAAVKIVSRRSAIELRSKSVLKMDHVFANMPARPNQKRIPFGIDREIVIMKVIEHPNIIKVYDVWENRGEMYLVLELVEGGELFEYIVANVRLPEAEAVRIFRQLLSGITHCHRFLLCHRDIKPENILLTGEGNVKIVDFGMASMQPKGSWLDTSCGSPHYAAPEVAQGQRYKGDKADIWSVGVVLYVMLCGSVPFGAHFDIEDELKGTDNLRRVLEEVVYNQPTYPSDLSDAAVDLIQLMLRKDPCERITAEEIWSHPLLLRYESYAKSPKYAQSWIGGPPTSLTSAECGPQFESKEDIDLDIVDNLCTLFHTNDTEALVNGLMSEDQNYEKVLYHRLLGSRIEQEENFQGCGVGVSPSDYHHGQRRPLKRSATKASLLGPGTKRTRSQFSIVEHSRRPSTVSRRALSEAGTESSYDPFRPSRHRFTSTDAEFARITVLRGGSEASRNTRLTSKAGSARRQAAIRIKNDESWISMESYIQGVPTGPDGYIRELRRQTIGRNISRSSMGSSLHSRANSGNYRRSASYRRGISFNHGRRRSSSHLTPPPRPRGPSPLNMHQKYLQDLPDSSQDTDKTSSRMTPDMHTSAPVRSRKERPLHVINADEHLPSPKKVKRASAYLSQEARQVSMELEKFCDDAFNASEDPSSKKRATGRSIVVTATPTYRRKASKETGNPSEIQGPHERSDSIETLKRRPLPESPIADPLASQQLRELEKTKQNVMKQASSLPLGTLDGVIGHLNHLIEQKHAEMEQNLRIVSAPDPRGAVQNWLSPVKEEDDRTQWRVTERDSSRHVSEPVYTSKGQAAYRGFGNENNTIRAVNTMDNKVVPAPLAIRKKTSGTTIRDDASPTFRKKKSTGTLLQKQSTENLCNEQLTDMLPNKKRSTEALGQYVQSRNVTVPLRTRYSEEVTYNDKFDDDYLEPIVEDDKENRDPQALKRTSRDSKGVSKKSWFRRSNASGKSSESDNSPPPPAPPVKDAMPQQSNFTARAPIQYRDTQTTAVDQASVDFSFRSGKRDVAAVPPPPPAKSRWYKLFGKKDSKAHTRPGLSVLDDDDASSMAPSSIISHSIHGGHGNQSNISVAHTRNVKFSEPMIQRKNQQQPAQNWLARFLHVKPAKRIIAFRVNKARATREVRAIFKDWKPYGMSGIKWERGTGRIWARVEERNTLNIKPVSVLVETFSVVQRGHAGHICVARVSQEQGAKSSFERVVDTLSDWLRCREMLILDKKKIKEMRQCLEEWEAT